MPNQSTKTQTASTWQIANRTLAGRVLMIAALAASTTTAIVTGMTAYSESASAHPVFARQHNMRCSGCHTTPVVNGQLNSNGRTFRDNGYQFGGGGGGGNGGGGGGIGIIIGPDGVGIRPARRNR